MDRGADRVAPLAGVLADRYSNRPFMGLGLALQAIGLGWVALIAEPGMGYRELGIAPTVAGVGISMCFPTVANAVLGSVPLRGAGVAARANSMLRELGGGLGIAALGSVFARQGVYESPQAFIDAFAQAPCVGGGFSALGAVAAMLAPGRKRRDPATAVAQPALALGGERP